MPRRRPSNLTLLLAWFLLSPLVVMVVAALAGWLAAAAAAAVGYVAIGVLMLVWRERTTTAATALAGLRGLNWGAHQRKR